MKKKTNLETSVDAESSELSPVEIRSYQNTALAITFGSFLSIFGGIYLSKAKEVGFKQAYAEMKEEFKNMGSLEKFYLLHR